MVKTYDKYTVYNKGDIVAIPYPSSVKDKQGNTKVSHSLKFYLALTNVPTFKDPSDKDNAILWELISLAAVTTDGIDVSAITEGIKTLEAKQNKLETKFREVLSKLDGLTNTTTKVKEEEEDTGVTMPESK